MKMKLYLKKIIPDWFKILYFQKRRYQPWSLGYHTYKFNLIKKAVRQPKLLQRFHDRQPLPAHYGYALDARIIEHPWIVAQLAGTPAGTLLDAGSALNYDYLMFHPAFQNKKITIVNLHPEPDCFWQAGISYVLADLRNLPFKDNCFDYVVSISTFQHIGMDNTFYYLQDRRYQEHNFDDYLIAAAELHRVLKPGGRFFLTVPFGQYQNFEWFQQYDSARIQKLITKFNPRATTITYYGYSTQGWNLVSKEIADQARYFDYRATKFFDHRLAKGYDPDHAAASRAVVCLELIK